jgi:hypothetical protein
LSSEHDVIKGPKHGKELSTLLSPTEVDSACRALEAIEDNRHPSQEDALALRLWAGPRYKMAALEEIAKKILNAAGEPATEV